MLQAINKKARTDNFIRFTICGLERALKVYAALQTGKKTGGQKADKQARIEFKGNKLNTLQ